MSHGHRLKAPRDRRTSADVTRTLTVIVPGDIETRTGGYEYDRRLIAALRHRGWSVALRSLDDGFPWPDRAARDQAVEILRGLADGSVVVVDGLALGVLAEEARAEARRLKLVALVHHPLALETGLSAAEQSQLFESERVALSAVRGVVVTSPATATQLERYGVGAADVSVVLPGTERGELARGSGGPGVRLLCVASIVPRKGHDVLLRALARLKDLPWALTCGGSLERSPGTVEALTAFARAEGIDGRVEFVGELSEAQLAAAYDRADVFVLPTLYEGYGMVVAEAIARGLPSVASDTGGIADLLSGEAGIVVPPGEVEPLTSALRRIIAEPDTRTRLAAGARGVRERLATWDAAAGQMEDVIVRVSAT